MGLLLGTNEYGGPGGSDYCGALLRTFLLGPILGPIAAISCALQCLRGPSCGCGEHVRTPETVVRAGAETILRSGLRPEHVSMILTKLAESVKRYAETPSTDETKKDNAKKAAKSSRPKRTAATKR